MAEAKTNQYESMFLLPTGVGDANAQQTLVRGMIERHGGQILVLKKWDERKLAYEIKKHKRGTYLLAFFKAPSKAIAPLERDVKLSEDVLRVLITRADHLNEAEMNAAEPQPIIREERPSYDRPYGDRDGGGRGQRDDRGDRGGDRGGDRAPRAPRREEAPAAAAAPAGDGSDKD